MTRGRRLALAVVGTLAAVVVASCGVDTDRSPRDILPDEQPSDTASTPGGGARPGTGSIVYFLGPADAGDGAPLRAVGREGRGDAASLLRALLDGPTADEQGAGGLRTAIPAGTTLRSATVISAGTLEVDVSSQFLSNAGDVLLDAVAQIVFTACGLEGVDRVRLLVDGEPQDWPTGSGNSTREPLTVFDFPGRLPSSQPDYPAVPSPTVATTAPPSTFAPGA